MVRSMTGYGQASQNTEHGCFHVEIKSVNHRYQETVIRMPREWSKLEDGLKKLVQRYVLRGRVEISITLEQDEVSGVQVHINWPLAEQYYEAAQQLANKFGLDDAFHVHELMALPNVMELVGTTPDSEQWLSQHVHACTEEALQQLVAMRCAEGEQLYNDMMQRFDILQSHCERIKQIVPEMEEAYHQALHQQLTELLADKAIDEHRLLMEVALLAERTNVDEELTRCASHFQMSKQMLRAGGAVGRKLDFLIQEMNREINTIGAKANVTEVINLVIDMKAELEKIREQVQNIE